ncbi:MAG: Mrp/NBP35 family ATP-binding protein [Polyangiaceae bacterium]|nr:Mrp/NBP35 family ATP-binding protein [Polyangiaceae bacterium]MCW5791834.1 Mrp/NBP35 family ATP-binding protein [Polyangiaceae bacterium]
MSSLEERATQILSQLVVPGLGRTLADLGMLGRVRAVGGQVTVPLKIQNPTYDGKEPLAARIHEALAALDGVSHVSVDWQVLASGRQVAQDDPVPGVRHVILVMSGKGGVGKSTVAANLALALKRRGARVGVLDADIYGPSIPTMFGVTGRPESNGERITPLQRFGVLLMSIGFLLDDPKSAVVWRGPMLHGALLQFLKDVAWGNLDYLLLDLPPGTGDVALTLAQRVSTTGAVVVTTPQEVALQDVYKSVSMAQKVGIRVLGVVENYSYFVCDGCEQRHELFGSGGGQKIAEFAEAELLGQLPITPSVREWGDAGTPVVQASPGSGIAEAFMAVADRLMEVCDRAEDGRAGEGFEIDRSGGQNRRLPVTR